MSGFNSTVSILLGKWDGTFASPVPYSAGEFLLTSMAAGDLNGDGKADLAVTYVACSFGFCNSGTEELLGNGVFPSGRRRLGKPALSMPRLFAFIGAK